MKKFLPYILSLVIGTVFGFILFQNNENDIKRIFKEEVKATGFQLGVFNSIDLAREYQKKFPTSIVMNDDDVYRVYISILTNNKTISKMEEYLNNNKIAFYKKNIVISDSSLIKALNNYEKNMLDGSESTFTSLNKLIMESYGGNI
jgi:hypothetical protein